MHTDRAPIELSYIQAGQQPTAAAMDDEGEAMLLNYEMYKAEGDLHLKKGLLAKAVDNYTKVLSISPKPQWL